MVPLLRSTKTPVPQWPPHLTTTKLRSCLFEYSLGFSLIILFDSRHRKLVFRLAANAKSTRSDRHQTSEVSTIPAKCLLLLLSFLSIMNKGAPSQPGTELASVKIRALLLIRLLRTPRETELRKAGFPKGADSISTMSPRFNSSTASVLFRSFLQIY